MPTAGKDLKGRKSMSRKKSLPGYVWLLSGLAIGLFIAFLVYLDKQPVEKLSFKEAITQELEKVKTNASSDTKKKANGKEPRFDFYTILPELEVFIPESEIQVSSRQKIKNNAAKGDKQYLLQAGSFRNKDDAERLKATLALLGVQSSVQSVSIKNDAWHRVRVGPFNDGSSLQQTLDTLRKNNIHAMTMELRN